jgi:hypothetical protein
MKYELSKHGHEMLAALSSGDPWADDSMIERCHRQIIEQFEEVVEPGSTVSTTAEDVVNRLGSELLCRIILLGDFVGGPVDLAETLHWQMDALAVACRGVIPLSRGGRPGA